MVDHWESKLSVLGLWESTLLVLGLWESILHTIRLGPLRVHIVSVGPLGVHTIVIGSLGVHAIGIGPLGVHTTHYSSWAIGSPIVSVGPLGVHIIGIGSLGVHFPYFTFNYIILIKLLSFDSNVAIVFDLNLHTIHTQYICSPPQKEICKPLYNIVYCSGNK